MGGNSRNLTAFSLPFAGTTKLYGCTTRPCLKCYPSRMPLKSATTSPTRANPAKGCQRYMPCGWRNNNSPATGHPPDGGDPQSLGWESNLTGSTYPRYSGQHSANLPSATPLRFFYSSKADLRFSAQALGLNCPYALNNYPASLLRSWPNFVASTIRKLRPCRRSWSWRIWLWPSICRSLLCSSPEAAPEEWPCLSPWH